MTLSQSKKTNPIQTQSKPISKAKKMLLRLTINGRRSVTFLIAFRYNCPTLWGTRCFYGILVRKTSFTRFIIDALLKKRILGLF